jgi:hypothetical protein
MRRFLTLGPGTNHEVVAARYLAFHDVPDTALSFVDAPDKAVDRLLAGTADWFVLCAVHPATPWVCAQFRRGVYIVDSFIAPSKPLAILTHAEVAAPRRIGLFRAVEDYADMSRWSEREVIDEGSLVTIGKRLLAREFESAVVYAELADQHPGRFRVDAEIESPDDAWLVLGTRRAAGRDGLVARRDSAVATVLAE